MSLIDRREVCKAITSLCFLNLASPLSITSSEMHATPVLSGDYPSQVTLSILLHGMFAIVFEKTGVRVMPPHVGGESSHVYLGSDLGSTPPVFSWLHRDVTYGFQFQGAAQRPKISEFDNAVVQLSDKIGRNDAVAPHCTICLPLPDEFVPLRSVGSSISNQPLFTVPKGLLKQPNHIPMVTMLRYRLAPNSIGWNVDYKYHLFAEPENCPKDFHTPDAFNSLKNLFFGLDDLSANTCLGPDDLTDIPDPAEINISSDEERALVQLEGFGNCMDPNPCNESLLPKKSQKAKSHRQEAAGPPSLAIHPTACMSMVFIPA